MIEHDVFCVPSPRPTLELRPRTIMSKRSHLLSDQTLGFSSRIFLSLSVGHSPRVSGGWVSQLRTILSKHVDCRSVGIELASVLEEGCLGWTLYNWHLWAFLFQQLAVALGGGRRLQIVTPSKMELFKQPFQKHTKRCQFQQFPPFPPTTLPMEVHATPESPHIAFWSSRAICWGMPWEAETAL